ncbi:MAG: peptidoglycan editing factor PgeF [Candidatus Omnitrophota bacterium]
MKLLKSYNPLEDAVGENVASAFSARAGGNMSLSYGETSSSLENRRSFLSSLGIDYKDLVCAKQVHGSRVQYVNEADKGRGALNYDTSIPDTDGFITDVRNLPLAIFTADCLSIFLYEPQRPAIGLVHAGWRSTRANIITCAVELMLDKFKANPNRLTVGFGSRIKDCCYEVSPEFVNDFSAGLVERAGSLYFDLAKANKKQLIDSGVKEENIFDSDYCTFCSNEELFSFRKEGNKSGRMLSVIMLK